MATADLDSPAAETIPPVPLRMTEEEFVARFTDEDVWAEWVDGEVVIMNATEPGHGMLLSFINTLLHMFVAEYELGFVMGESVAVRLPRQRRRRLPDVFFVGNEKLGQIEPQHFEGPPDLIVEVVSPDGQRRDRREKFAEYEAAGVPEYWLADRPMRTFEAYTLGADGRYARIPEVDGAAHSVLLPGLFFRTEWVWQLRFPKPGPLLQAMAVERAKRLAAG